MEHKDVLGIKYHSTGEWHEIEYQTITDDDGEQDVTGFTCNGKWHNLDNYIRTNNTAWNNEPYHHAEGLHARDITSYYKPDYIELNEFCDAVKVWHQE